MNFKEAYKAMQEGKKVRRKGWIGYWFIEDEKVKIHLKDGNIKFNNFTQETIANTLEEDWEVVEEGKKYWEPKKDEKYYYITECGDVDNHLYSNCLVNDDYLYANWLLERARFNIGNCFKTKEEAEHMVEKLKVIHELQKFAFENNEGKIDWNDTKQYKRFLVYDTDDKEICVDYRTYVKNEPFNIYFTSFNLARQAIKTIGEDRIKKYYFDVEE